MPNENIIYIKNRRDKDRSIKDAIFAFSGGQKRLLIKGEGEEISTAVEVAEILKSKLYPGVEIANVSLGSRPFYQRRQKGYHNKNPKDRRNQKDLVSKIEILLKTKNIM